MIILDANILYKGPDTVTTDLLQTIQAAGVEKVGIPSVALEELVAQRVNPYRERYEQAARAWEKICEDTPWSLPPKIPRVDVHRYAAYWRKQYQKVAIPLLASESVLHEAMVREMNLLPPCKLVGADADNKGHKIGARDAAIWLTAIQYARDEPQEKVYFVSANTHDFGSGASYPSPMNADVEDLGDRFVHLTNLNALVELFAEPALPDNSMVRAVLEKQRTADFIALEAFRSMHARNSGVAGVSSKFECTTLADDAVESIWARGWLSKPVIRLEKIGEVKAHSIREHVWCSVEATWGLLGVAEVRHSRRLVGCVWKTRILISTTEQEAEPSLLRSEKPQPASRDSIQKLTQLDKPSLGVPGWLESELLKEVPWEMDVEIPPGYELSYSPDGAHYLRRLPRHY